ncbi:MAG: hypothetical protein MZV64_44325 [Ignavibacteriales bacterium]|nr:hypothetical protein [Ignavibacteriales bacterium]
MARGCGARRHRGGGRVAGAGDAGRPGRRRARPAERRAPPRGGRGRRRAEQAEDRRARPRPPLGGRRADAAARRPPRPSARLARRPAVQPRPVVFVLAARRSAPPRPSITLLDAVVLSPLPFPHGADRLVTRRPRVSRAPGGGGRRASCAAWHYTYEEENRVFDGLWRMWSAGDGGHHRVRASPRLVPSHVRHAPACSARSA